MKDSRPFPRFFEAATGHPPYDWQGRLANGDDYEAGNPAIHTGTACESRLIDIPTGLGKTAGVVIAWLWNFRSQHENFLKLRLGKPQRFAKSHGQSDRGRRSRHPRPL